MDAEAPDPYTPRPSRAYVRADAEASSTPPPDSQPTSTDQGTRAEGGDDEPLFGGTPFRDAAPGGPSAGAEAAHDPGDRDEYYALLNVEKNASEATIKEAFKTLSLILHPDKHPDPVRKAEAQAQFRRVHAAYEVLSNPEQRAIYDQLGQTGLASHWTVATRGQTAAELRAEIERDVLARRVREAEGLIQSKADFAAHIDASALLAPSERVPRPAARAGSEVTWSDRWNRVGVTQLLGKHSFDTQVTDSTWVQFSGHMLSRNGLGGGNFVGTVKTQVSPRFQSEWTASLLRPRMLTNKGTYALDPNTFVSYQAALQHPAVPPVIALTFGQRISSRSYLTGFTSLRSGTYQLGPWGDPEWTGIAVRPEPTSVAVGLTSQTSEASGWTTQATLSALGQAITVEWWTKVLGGVKLRMGGSIGTAQGLQLHASGERRVTETLRLGLGLSTGLPGPVVAKLKLNRLGQRITLPIILAPEWRSDLVVCCTLLPALGMSALHYGWLVPRRRKRISKKLELLRQENQEIIAERRASAQGARALLRDQALKKYRAEREKGGVVIVQAWYGNQVAFPAAPSDWNEEEQRLWEEDASPADPVQPEESTSEEPKLATAEEDESVWDVRVVLQAMIQKSQLIIPGGRAKSHILGFFDPCMGEKKHLVIRYLFRGRLHETIVDDINPVALPLRSHQLDY